jgi:hypothetical protein
METATVTHRDLFADWLEEQDEQDQDQHDLTEA